MSIVCIGDSLTFGYGVEKEEGWVSILSTKVKEKIINKGVPGNTMYEMKERFVKDVIKPAPNKVLIMGGTNDIFLNGSLNDILNNIDAMVKLSIKNEIIPIIITPIPVNGDIKYKTWFENMDYKKVNEKLSNLRKSIVQYGKKENIKVIDLGTILLEKSKMKYHFLNDGIHVSKEMHREIAEIIFNLIC